MAADPLSQIIGLASSQRSGGVAQLFSSAVPVSSAGPFLEQLSALAAQLQALRSSSETQSRSVDQNTRALSQNTASRGAGGSTAGSVLQGAAQTFGFGLGLSPLIKGLFSLFGGGGDTPAPPPLPAYSAPAPLRIEAQYSGNSVVAADRGQNNELRPLSATPQITVNVQAMDSQSFLDRSNDIALAVRRAMLESSVLNDVLREV